MERINERTPAGISGSSLRAWGMVFLTLGVFGRGILQGRVLGLHQVNAQQLLELMTSSSSAMAVATISLVLQAVETCAAPIFAFLLVEGVRHTKNLGQYLFRVTVLALLCEIPYNLAIGGRVLDMSTRNPVFGAVLSLILLYFFRRYPGRSLANVLIKVVVTLAAFIWSQMLSIEFGAAMVVLTAALWLTWQKTNYRVIVGTMAAMLCTLISPFFLASPMSFLTVHLYNGEEGSLARPVRYLMYPAILLVLGLAGNML